MHPSHYAKASPNKPAFILASTGETVTYAQLEKRSNQIAQLFRSLGLKPDDHIAIHMENNRHFMEIVWGAQRSGIIYTAISTHLREDEIAYIVDNCEAKLLISSSKLGDLARNIRSRCSGLQHCFMVEIPYQDMHPGRIRLKVRVICRLPMKNEAYKCCIHQGQLANQRVSCPSELLAIR